MRADGIAVAVDIANLADPTLGANGMVARFALDGTPIDTVEVGNLPDMPTYSNDGTLIFVANEGGREDAEDTKGSISFVDVATGTAETFTFDAVDAVVDELREAGVRIFPGTLPSTDFEPGYIAEGPDGKLYVTRQEASATTVFDLASRSWAKIVPLGTVDHSLAGFGIDPSDRDDAIAIREVPQQGLRMPDAIAVTEIDGETYIFTENEGDSCDFDESRGDDLSDGDLTNGEVDLTEIGPAIAAALADDAALGRLTLSNIDGDTDGDDLIDGGNGKDVIAERGGDDETRGGNGADLIVGGAGDDAIEGGNGADRLSGGLGDDEIRGGNGADIIHGGAGHELLDGGRGPDRFVFAIGEGKDTIVRLDAADVIGLSATGLGFADLAITDLGGAATRSPMPPATASR